MQDICVASFLLFFVVNFSHAYVYEPCLGSIGVAFKPMFKQDYAALLDPPEKRKAGRI